MSRFNKISSLIKKGNKDEAIKALDEIIPTPEKAVSLRGNDRAEYLDALDSIYGDQAKRAKDLGFDPETYYHGTAGNFDKFNLNALKNYGRLSPKDTIFTTNNPEVAGEFANFAEDIKAIREDNLDSAANIMPLKLNTSDFLKQTGRGLDQPMHEFTRFAAWNNLPGGVVTNAADNPNMINSTTTYIKDPSRIRSVNAAFDPRFKDSDLILALNKQDKSTLSKVGDALSIPQRVASRKVAEALGIPSGKTSEETFQNIVQSGAEKIGDLTGLDPDSAPMNAAKALGVAAGEVFADPLALLPVGKVANMTGKGLKKIKNAEALQTAINKLKIAKEAGETVGKQTGVDSRSFNTLRELLKGKK
jgi:hypothetical protein